MHAISYIRPHYNLFCEDNFLGMQSVAERSFFGFAVTWGRKFPKNRSLGPTEKISLPFLFLWFWVLLAVRYL